MNTQVAKTPPVTVLHIPRKYGSRGFGCKIDNQTLIITHNPSTVKAFADINPKVTIMVRKRWELLPVYTEVAE